MNANAVVRPDRSGKVGRFIRPFVVSASPLSLDNAPSAPEGYVVALAHEVRNPLCNIDLALEMLNPMDLDEEVRLYLDIVRRGSIRINNLITTLLISEQAKVVSYEYFSLHMLLDEVLVMTSDRISLKRITVSREYNATEHRAFLNRENMKIAISNIVINAIDAMAMETGALEVVTRSTNEHISIEIRDNGMGISEENLTRIFEPFFTKKPGGLGLGLSATMDILRANHTRVEVRSEEGVGTCFTLSFDKR